MRRCTRTHIGTIGSQKYLWVCAWWLPSRMVNLLFLLLTNKTLLSQVVLRSQQLLFPGTCPNSEEVLYTDALVAIFVDMRSHIAEALHHTDVRMKDYHDRGVLLEDLAGSRRPCVFVAATSRKINSEGRRSF